MTTTVPMKQWFGFFFFFYCSIVIPYIYIYPSTINASSSTKLLLLLLLSSLALHDASSVLLIDYYYYHHCHNTTGFCNAVLSIKSQHTHITNTDNNTKINTIIYDTQVLRNETHSITSHCTSGQGTLPIPESHRVRRQFQRDWIQVQCI